MTENLISKLNFLFVKNTLFSDIQTTRMKKCSRSFKKTVESRIFFAVENFENQIIAEIIVHLHSTPNADPEILI